MEDTLRVPASPQVDGQIVKARRAHTSRCDQTSDQPCRPLPVRVHWLCSIRSLAQLMIPSEFPLAITDPTAAQPGFVEIDDALGPIRRTKNGLQLASQLRYTRF